MLYHRYLPSHRTLKPHSEMQKGDDKLANVCDMIKCQLLIKQKKNIKTYKMINSCHHYRHQIKFIITRSNKGASYLLEHFIAGCKRYVQNLWLSCNVKDLWREISYIKLLQLLHLHINCNLNWFHIVSSNFLLSSNVISCWQRI